MPDTSLPRSRKTLSKATQLAIFRRDEWLCYWCNKPVVFAPAMNLLALEVKAGGSSERLAYYHRSWTREGAPLLDELGAVLDHVDAFSTGGECSEENLRTACWKCNVRKGSKAIANWEAREKRKAIKGKYGEPKHWDGLTAVFVMLAKRHLAELTIDEKTWLKALEPKALSPMPAQ